MMACPVDALARFVPGESRSEVKNSYGIKVPFRGKHASSTFMGVNYGQWKANGLGWRAGFDYMPEYLGIDGCYSMPLSFSYRTPLRESLPMLDAGLTVLGASMYAFDDNDSFYVFLLEAMLFLVDRVEFNVGVTPGYIDGGSTVLRSIKRGTTDSWIDSGTEPGNSVFVSLDAGISFSFHIWRFTLGFTPAFHYYVAGKYLDVYREVDGGVQVADRLTPLRWHFSLCANMGLMF